VHIGWAKELKTSMLAFDVAQFFPSLNHDMLVAILCKQGFAPNVVQFFGSYLVGCTTHFAWGGFVSNPQLADVGVGQGSALSPVLSALYLVPMMHLYKLSDASGGTTLLSYADDGTIIAQAAAVKDNLDTLQVSYAVIFDLFTKLGLELEHHKLELFPFDCAHKPTNPLLDLGYAPYTGNTLLILKTY
jgi:hypothetical protein